MNQDLFAATILLSIGCILLLITRYLKKTKYAFLTIWIRIVITFLWNIGLYICLGQNYIPESFPASSLIFVFLGLCCIGFTAAVIVKIYKMLNKSWAKVLFLVPTLLISVIWASLICLLPLIIYERSNELYNKFSSGSNPDKTLYIFPNSGDLFSRPGFSFYYRSGKLPVMEYKVGYNAIEIRKITRKGDTLVCDLCSTRVFFSHSDIQLLFNLRTGTYTEH